MGSIAVWFVTTLFLAVGVALTLGLGESVWTGGVLSSRRSRGLALLGSAVLLALLATLLLSGPVARADGSVIRALSHSRTGTLDAVMSVLTVVGDSVPSFTIAGGLAVVIYRNGVHPYACWVLPLAVLAELLAQFAVGRVFDDLTIADVAADLTAGHHGSLPSGSVARLFLIFMISARLWHATNPRQSRNIVTIGGVLLVLQSVSRLYLGRHLVLDIVGGLVLGLGLFLLVSLIIQERPQVSREHNVGPEGGAIR